MAKEEVYVPQFDYGDDLNKSMFVCVKCGEKSLTSYGGLCFECKKEIGFEPTELNTSFSPNEKQYNDFLEEKIKKRTLPFAMGLLWRPLLKYGITLIICLFAIDMFYVAMIEKNYLFSLLSIILFVFGILIQFFRKKLRHRKFCKYNTMIIEMFSTHGWTCPCCDEVNYSLNHCKVCGVRPTLVFKNIGDSQ